MKAICSLLTCVFLFAARMAVAQVAHIDVPNSNFADVYSGPAHVVGTHIIAGWACAACAPTSDGDHVDAVHVWLLPLDGTAAVFVGDANLHVVRPDVAAVYGAQFSHTGWWVVTPNAVPVNFYRICAFVHSDLTGTFMSYTCNDSDNIWPNPVETSMRMRFTRGWANIIGNQVFVSGIGIGVKDAMKLPEWEWQTGVNFLVDDWAPFGYSEVNTVFASDACNRFFLNDCNALVPHQVPANSGVASTEIVVTVPRSGWHYMRIVGVASNPSLASEPKHELSNAGWFFIPDVE